jgi:hypothetical protein
LRARERGFIFKFCAPQFDTAAKQLDFVLFGRIRRYGRACQLSEARYGRIRPNEGVRREEPLIRVSKPLNLDELVLGIPAPDEAQIQIRTMPLHAQSVTKAVGFSGSQFGFVIETFNDSGRDICFLARNQFSKSSR